MPSMEAQPRKGLRGDKLARNAELQQKEAELEAALFGTADAIEGFGLEAAAPAPVWLDDDDEAAPDEAPSAATAGGAVALWEDRRGDAGAAGDASDADAVVGRKRRGGAVWEDPDDANVEVAVAGRSRLRKLRHSEDEAVLSGEKYEQRLRAQHSKLNPRTAWATRRTGDSLEDAEGDLTAGGALARPSRLPKGTIEVTPLADANKSEPSASVVRSVEFHPNGQLLLTAGLDKRLRLFQIDGVRNPKMQSVFLDDMPIHRAAFASGGSQVIMTGRRRHFYLYDLGGSSVARVSHIAGVSDSSLETFAVSPAGQAPGTVAFLGDEGRISLVSLRSRQLTGTLRMAGTARAAAFAPDGQQLLSLGGDGVVHTWDLRTHRCIGRAVDEGCVRGAALACSADMFATGSDAGVVNVHRRQAAVAGGGAGVLQAGLPAPASFAPPAKSLMNLATTVDSLAFSPDQQILAMGSRMTRGALRLVHTPSMTVFANWPTRQTPLQYVHSIAFSPGGGLLAVGTARGRALLYRLNHYARA